MFLNTDFVKKVHTYFCEHLEDLKIKGIMKSKRLDQKETQTKGMTMRFREAAIQEARKL